MNLRRPIALAAAALLATACFKDVSYKTTYILKPLTQQASGDLILPLEGAEAFAYSVDTTLWTVLTYEDALAGIITQKDNPAERMVTPAAVGEPYTAEGTAGWLQLSIANPSQMVVVVDPASRLYAYTQQKLAQNLPNLYVSVVFKPWKEGNSYKDGNWSFYNEFYVAPVYLDAFVEPLAQYEQGGQTAAVPSVKAYAYAADTTAWYIASYQDALDGVITSKSDPALKRENPNFPAYKESDSDLYKMRVSEPTLMVVVVDQTDKMYAYSQQKVDLEGEAITFPVIFRTWVKEWITVDGAWRIVDETHAPGRQDPDAEEDAARQRRDGRQGLRPQNTDPQIPGRR